MSIKLPVRVRPVTMGICDADNKVVAVCMDAYEVVEIAKHLNAYPSLVKQRDALEKVRTLTSVYLGLWPPAAGTMQAAHYADLSEAITATLALVREDADG